jgi:hypothetical protein
VQARDRLELVVRAAEVVHQFNDGALENARFHRRKCVSRKGNVERVNINGPPPKLASLANRCRNYNIGFATLYEQRQIAKQTVRTPLQKGPVEQSLRRKSSR